MFTPVSSQAQAFVPAHAAYPHLRPNADQGQDRGGGGGGGGMMLYGAHGQPLPAQQQTDASLPPPQGMYQYPYGPPGAPPSLPIPIHQDVS